MGIPGIDSVDIICPVCGKNISVKSGKEMIACQWVMISVMFMDFLKRNSKGGVFPGKDDYKKPKEWGV